MCPLVAHLNRAYTKNLVHKDSFANGNGGPNVDMKRVLDLSPEQIEEMKKNDPDLALFHEGTLKTTLDYWADLKAGIAPKVVCAVYEAIGSDVVVKDAVLNYRMVTTTNATLKMLTLPLLLFVEIIVTLAPSLWSFQVMLGSRYLSTMSRWCTQI